MSRGAPIVRSRSQRPARRLEGHRRLARGARPRARRRRRHRRHAAPAAAPPRRSWRSAGLSRRAARGRPAAHRRATSACAKPRPIPSCTRNRRARKTADKAINILQGRCVGGGTTVNWTSSFRTPPRDAAHWWEREYGLTDFAADAMAPWFARMEERLVDRAVDRRAQREQRRRCARGAAQARHPDAGDPAQREGLLEPRLLRHGLPDQRQAVDAGHDDPRRARSRRHARHARARAALRASRGDAGHGARSARDGRHRHCADRRAS